MSEESNLEFQSLKIVTGQTHIRNILNPEFQEFSLDSGLDENSYNKTKGHKFLYLDPGMAFEQETMKRPVCAWKNY